MITLKTPEQLEIMRKAGKIAADTLTFLKPYVVPGTSAERLDKLAEDFIRAHGAIPSCKGYRNFPATMCISINHQAVHCIPSGQLIKEGDIVKLDLVVGYEGFHADTAKTFMVAPVSEEVKKFVETGYAALQAGIVKALDGNTISSISNAVADVALKAGYGIVGDFTGHGIGRQIHEQPQVPNFRLKDTGPKLSNGMTICIEPILTMTPQTDIFHDGPWNTWTISGAPVVHFEHTVALTPAGPEILTLRPEETT